MDSYEEITQEDYAGVEETLNTLLKQQEPQEEPEAPPAEEAAPPEPQQPDPVQERLSQYEQHMQRLYQNEYHAAQTIRQQQQELAALKARMEQQFQQPQKQDQLPEDPMERLVEERVRARMERMEEDLRKRHQEEIAPIQQTLQQQQAMSAWQQRAQQSQEIARQRYEDYDDVAMAAVPWLQQQQQRASMGDQNAQAMLNMVTASPDPAEVLYTLGLRFRFEQQKSQAANQPAPPTKAPAPPGQGNNVVQMPRGADIPGGAAGGGELDLSSITSEEWAKLPDDVRSRILRGE
jgi:hypothetical protein